MSPIAAIENIPGDYKSDIIISINAGIDMVMVPGAVRDGKESFQNFLKLFKESVEEGSIPMERVDDAVKRSGENILSVSDLSIADRKIFDDLFGKQKNPMQTMIGGMAKLSLITRRNLFYDDLFSFVFRVHKVLL